MVGVRVGAGVTVGGAGVGVAVGTDVDVGATGVAVGEGVGSGGSVQALRIAPRITSIMANFNCKLTFTRYRQHSSCHSKYRDVISLSQAISTSKRRFRSLFARN